MDDGAQPRTSQQALSDPGIETFIPLRFVTLQSCSTCGHAGAYDHVLASVDAANEVFKAAGIQFWMRSYERIWLPQFANITKQACGGVDEKAWSLVRSDIQTLFPSTPSNYWTDTTKLSPHFWLKAANTGFSKADELLVYVKDIVDDPGDPANCSGRSYANGPDQGRMIIMEGDHLGVPYMFAHELGHYFGLEHSWQWSGTTTNPETNVPFSKADNWDLVYKPGSSSSNPHLFFSSRAEAAAYPDSALFMIQDPNLCTITSNGVSEDMTCAVGTLTYYEVYGTGSPQLKGLSIPAATRNGINIMSYWADRTSTGGGALSDSQVERIRKYLRWDVPLTSTFQAEVKAGAQHSGRRQLLGSWNTRDSTRMLDFDGDGKHDVGWWIPPRLDQGGAQGTVKVLLSSQGFSSAAGQHINTTFGNLGDSPVPQRMNYGDSRTDIVFYQPGGGINRNAPDEVVGWWRQCLTANPPASTNCSSPPSPAQWGDRGDVPLSNVDFDGSGATPELAVYRQSTATFHWNYVGGGWSNSRTLGTSGDVPMAALVDSDSQTDLVTYSPGTATFHMRMSGSSWNTVVDRFTHSKFIPQYSATSGSARSGAVVLDGIDRPSGFGSDRRRTLSLWYPYDGTWNTLWSPLTSSAYSTCQWGIGSKDIPIVGIDRDNDRRSDLVVLRLDGVSSTAKIHFRTWTTSGCGSGAYTVNLPLLGRARLRAFAVADMTGDGRPEILITDPEYGMLFWLKSEQDYATTYFLGSMGDQHAVLF
ncbi:MAG: hypothetical protein R3B13_29500 [Polyangiaceae bacterium]